MQANSQQLHPNLQQPYIQVQNLCICKINSWGFDLHDFIAECTLPFKSLSYDITLLLCTQIVQLQFLNYNHYDVQIFRSSWQLFGRDWSTVVHEGTESQNQSLQKAIIWWCFNLNWLFWTCKHNILLSGMGMKWIYAI